MIYVVPSRGRPQSISTLIGSWEATRVHAELFIALDTDDPELGAYERVLAHRPEWVKYGIADTRSMVMSLNRWANRAAYSYAHDVVGFMGDDHHPRTYAWDTFVAAAVTPDDGPSKLVYCNDLLQGPMLPTQAAMPATWIRRLGRMAPTSLHHLYVDNYWKTLGERLRRIQYLADVVIEHMHPVAGKAEWDEGYKRVNAGDVYEQDAAAFATFMILGLDADVSALEGLK